MNFIKEYPVFSIWVIFSITAICVMVFGNISLDKQLKEAKSKNKEIKLECEQKAIYCDAFCRNELRTQLSINDSLRSIIEEKNRLIIETENELGEFYGFTKKE